LNVLVLGGSAWLGGRLAREALDRGHAVWCLARGESGRPPGGATLIGADRRSADGYDKARTRDWDVVIDVCSQPGLVRSALAALRVLSEAQIRRVDEAVGRRRGGRYEIRSKSRRRSGSALKGMGSGRWGRGFVAR
jgi:putative NADH-flavin reductase